MGSSLWRCPYPQLPDKLIPSLVKYYYSWKDPQPDQCDGQTGSAAWGRKDKEDRSGPGKLWVGVDSAPAAPDPLPHPCSLAPV